MTTTCERNETFAVEADHLIRKIGGLLHTTVVERRFVERQEGVDEACVVFQKAVYLRPAAIAGGTPGPQETAIAPQRAEDEIGIALRHVDENAVGER